MPKLPDRWLNYTNVGDVIQGTKLITFKVPLKESFFAHNDRIPEDRRFTPTTLLECMGERGLKLGLVIDLTFTDRYYDKEEFTSKGVQYKKIFVKGHVIPKQEVMDSFYEAIDQFLETSEEGSLIGVHCTHGVNRTGYVVCRYMVEHLGMKATDALEAYAEARGYPVERVNYINDLKVRAGEPVEEVEEEEGESSQGRRQNHSSHHHRGRGRGHQRGHHHHPRQSENNGHQDERRQNGYYRNRHDGGQNDFHYSQNQYGSNSPNWRNPNNQFYNQGAYGYQGNQHDQNAGYGYGNGYYGNQWPQQQALPYGPNGPWNSYGSPQPNGSSPWNNHGSPQPNVNGPWINHGSPQPNGSSPWNNHGSPQPNGSSPWNNHGSPQPNGNAPWTCYRSPQPPYRR